MGAFLDKPKTEKTNDVGLGKDYRYVVASMQGWRIDMEDAHHVQVILANEPPFQDWSFFAVFDGHAGSKVAFHSAQNLLQTLLETPAFRSVKEELKSNGPQMTERAKELIRDGMRAGFLTLDSSMEEMHGGGERERSGTTAICAILTPDCIFFANLGDSRGVLSRRDTAVFSTEDHKPYNEKERDRIVKAGGSVMIQRVNGSLAVSRALGDFEYKAVQGLSACEQLVSPEPDIYIQPRNKEIDEFLILACDGIYDVLSNEELCTLVRSRLQINSDLKMASNQVLDVCLSKGSRDNMTMIMVVFEAAPKFDAALALEEKAWLEQVEVKARALLNDSEHEIDDADAVTLMLKDEFDESAKFPGGIHLARSLIDALLAEKEKEKEQQATGAPDAKVRSVSGAGIELRRQPNSTSSEFSTADSAYDTASSLELNDVVVGQADSTTMNSAHHMDQQQSKADGPPMSAADGRE